MVICRTLHQTTAERMVECREIIQQCREMIVVIEKKAAQFPKHTQLCGEVIRLEKQIIEQYQEEINALLNEKV